MPPRKKLDSSLTPLEFEIMNVLWADGPANVQNVQSRLRGASLAYTTAIHTVVIAKSKAAKQSSRLAPKAGSLRSQ